MNEQFVKTAHGGMLYDPSLSSKPAGSTAGDEWFEPAFWQQHQLGSQMSGGRGSVWFIRDPAQSPPVAWVLRHYRRGGLMARVAGDRYAWIGADATRSFREWRLLKLLRARHLPVPIPIAARYVRCGLIYRADIITDEIVAAQSLTQRLSAASLPLEIWQRIGATLARFHALGVHHADLNANNILLDAGDEIHVLDFDRGRIQAPALAWIDRVLARLLRSLTKLHAQRGIHFHEADWRALDETHDVELQKLMQQAGQARL